MVLDHVFGDAWPRFGPFRQSSERQIKEGPIRRHNPFGLIKQTPAATIEQLRIKATAQRRRLRGTLSHRVNKTANVLSDVSSWRQSPKLEPFATNHPHARFHVSQMKAQENFRWS
jgi:hypothetical protein